MTKLVKNNTQLKTKHHVNSSELTRLEMQVMHAIEFNILLSHRLFFV